MLAPGAAVVALAFSVLFVGGGTRYAIGLVLKPMAEELGWERGVLGAAVAVFMLTTAATMIVVGRLADRFAVSWVLAGGFAVSAVGIAAISEAVLPWHVLALYGVVFAAGSGAVSLIPVGVMISRRFPQRMASANAMAISGMGLGQLVILSGMTAVLAGYGWQVVFRGLGLICLVLIPLLLLNGVRERRGGGPSPPTASESGFGEALHRPVFWLLLLIYAFCGFHDFFVSTHVVAFALDRGLSPWLAGNLLAFMGLTGLVGVVGAGVWSDRSGPFGPLMACLVLRTLLFGMIPFVQGPAAIAAFALLFGITFWVTAPLLVVFVRDAFGIRHLGALTGLITSVHHVCGGLGAFFGAVLFDADGSYQRAFLAMGAGAVLAFVGSLFLRTRMR